MYRHKLDVSPGCLSRCFTKPFIVAVPKFADLPAYGTMEMNRLRKFISFIHDPGIVSIISFFCKSFSERKGSG